MAIQHHNFTLLKTTLIGLALSALSAVGLFYLAMRRHLLPRGGYIWSYEFDNRVIHNPIWWICVIGSFLIAFIVARKTRRMILWIAVALTSCVALYLAYGYSLNYFLRH